MTVAATLCPVSSVTENLAYEAEAMKARNIAVHVYRETFAQELGEKLAPLYVAFNQLLQKLPSV